MHFNRHQNRLLDITDMKKTTNSKRKSESLQKPLIKIFRQNGFRSKWMKAVTILASVVVFITVYMLILPASALDKGNAKQGDGIYLLADAGTDGGRDAVTNTSVEAVNENPDESGNDSHAETPNSSPANSQNESPATGSTPGTVNAEGSDNAGNAATGAEGVNAGGAGIGNQEGQDTAGDTAGNPSVPETGSSSVEAGSNPAETDSGSNGTGSNSAEAGGSTAESSSESGESTETTGTGQAVQGEEGSSSESQTSADNNTSGAGETPASGEVPVLTETSAVDEVPASEAESAATGASASENVSVSGTVSESAAGPASGGTTAAEKGPAADIILKEEKEELEKGPAPIDAFTDNSLEWHDDYTTVRVNFDEEAKIPEGSVLEVIPLEKGTEEFRAYFRRALIAGYRENNELTEEEIEKKVARVMAGYERELLGGKAMPNQARIFDIKIMNPEGTEIEPSEPIGIDISFTDGMIVRNDARMQLVHFAEEEKAEAAGKASENISDAESDRNIQETAENKEENQIKTLFRKAARFLGVFEAAEETESKSAGLGLNRSEDIPTATPSNLREAKLLPEEDLTEEADEDYLNRAEILTATELSGEDPSASDRKNVQSISFTTGSVSVYAVVYTVDFEYEEDGETYHFTAQGAADLPLSALLTELNICETESVATFLSNITDVTASNPEVLKVSMISEGTAEVPAAAAEDGAETAEVDEANVEDKDENEDDTEGSVEAETGSEAGVDAVDEAGSEAEAEREEVESTAAVDWLVRPLKASDEQENLLITMVDGSTFTVKVGLTGTTEVAAKNEMAVISTINDLYLPQEAEAYAKVVEDADAAITAVQNAAVPAEEDTETAEENIESEESEETPEKAPEAPANTAGKTFYQVYEIRLDNVDAKDYEGFQVQVALPESIKGRDFHLYHIHEGETTDITKELSLTVDTAEDGIQSISGFSFQTDDFSEFVLQYTVDFTYDVNGKIYNYSMQGADSVSLRSLVETLRIYEKAPAEDDQDNNTDNKALDQFMADIEAVTFSNESLLVPAKVKEDTTAGKIKSELKLFPSYPLGLSESEVLALNAKKYYSGDWILISMKPFNTEETLTVKLRTGESFEIKVTDAQDAFMVGDRVQTISNPAGTTIDLFDYWIVSQELNGRDGWGDLDQGWGGHDDSQGLNGSGNNKGINSRTDDLEHGHALKFSPAWEGTVFNGTKDGWTSLNTDHRDGLNSYTGNANPFQGIVGGTLVNGYPVLTSVDRIGSNGESLAYLFNPAIAHEGKASYPNVDQLLYVDRDGYYTYDSRDYRADFNDGSFVLTEQTSDDTEIRGFWPFGTQNFWTGLHINTQFSMPADGKVLNPRGEYKEMQFEFSGDDDTWLYVDGVLVGDGGGIHNRTEIDINFAKGTVTVTGKKGGGHSGDFEKIVYLDEIFESDNDDWEDIGDGSGHKRFKAGTYHTFDMFYLERGGGESNLYIHYNLVSTADFTAHKSYSGFDEDDAMQRNQFRFELIGLDGKYRSVWNEAAGDYILVQEDTISKAIMPHASSTGAGTTVSPYYSDNYSIEMQDGTTVNSQIYITGNVEDGNVNFGNAQISEQEMHNCDEGKPSVYRYVVREVIPDDAVNADNITWANATPEQRAAGGFVKDSVVYDNTVYYMAARVTSWTETDASGTPKRRYGLSKTYYTDDTYTTKKENTPFIDFRNGYQPDHADFEFDKLNANEEPVQGAVFQLFRDSACKIPAKDSNNQIVNATSGADGKVAFTNTRTGIYFMKEVTAPEPYDLNPTVYRVTISKQGSHMSVHSDQNNTPVTEVYNLKSTDIAVKKKWVNEAGEEVSGEGHPATIQLRRYRYVSTAPAPETHDVTLHFHFPYASWNTPNKDFGPYTITGNSVNIHWSVPGCRFFRDAGKTQLITSGNDNLIQMPLTDNIDLDIYGEFDWASNNLSTVSVDGAFDNSKELRLDDTFPSEAEKSKATQVLTDEHPMHAWSFGKGEGFDFLPGDELGLYLYYVVELNNQEQEVAIGGNVDEGMKLRSIAYEPEKVDGKGITHGIITVTNEVAAETPATVDITILKVDNDNNNIRLGGAIFELTKVQSLETVNQVSDDPYSKQGTTSDANDETKGKLSFTSLTPGYYYLHETQSPEGYVTTTNGWHFQVDANGIVSGVGDFDPNGFFRYVDENNMTVTNQKGAALPHTGGIGTTIFYIIGTILVIGAGILLVTRRRMHDD